MGFGPCGRCGLRVVRFRRGGSRFPVFGGEVVVLWPGEFLVCGVFRRTLDTQKLS